MELKKLNIRAGENSVQNKRERKEGGGGDRKPRKIKIILCTVHHCAQLTFHRTQF